MSPPRVLPRAKARARGRDGSSGWDDYALVPDVPKWREYSDRIQLRGRAAGGAHLTLIESVRQDRRRRVTTTANPARSSRRTSAATGSVRNLSSKRWTRFRVPRRST